MIAYDKNLLDNTFLVEQANKLKKAEFITASEFNTISSQIPVLKSQNNIFVRLFFFVLGGLLYLSVGGFLALLLFFNHSGEDTAAFFIYLLCIIGIVAVEITSGQKKQYGYGLDDAFLLGSQLCLFAAIYNSSDENTLAVLIAISIAAVISYFRYIHLCSALLACLGITASLGYVTFEYLAIGKTILPFVMLLFSGICYFIFENKLQNLTAPYYYNGLKLVKGFCLILFYLAGNYYVVRELNFSLSGGHYYNNVMSPEIPFGLFFWAFTFITPVVYLFFSLKNKDRMMLWIGFLTLCFSFFSFRIYHHVLPPEAALTIGGLVLFAFTYFAIKKTKHSETGITFKEDRFANPNAFVNLQTLVTASQFGLKPEVKPEESPMEFGGGGFSGGGSGGEF